MYLWLYWRDGLGSPTIDFHACQRILPEELASMVWMMLSCRIWVWSEFCLLCHPPAQQHNCCTKREHRAMVLTNIHIVSALLLLLLRRVIYWDSILLSHIYNCDSQLFSFQQIWHLFWLITNFGQVGFYLFYQWLSQSQKKPNPLSARQTPVAI